jgi:hypothetical protein
MEHPPQAPEEEGLEKAEQVGRIREALTRGEDEDSTNGRGDLPIREIRIAPRPLSSPIL